MKNRTKQILLGMASGVVLWIGGILLSGRFDFVEEIKLYRAGALVLLYPLFLIALTVAAAVAIKKDKKAYGVTSLICMYGQMLWYPICFLYGVICNLLPDRSRFVEILLEIPIFLSSVIGIPFISVCHQFMVLFGF